MSSLNYLYNLFLIHSKLSTSNSLCSMNELIYSVASDTSPCCCVVECITITSLRQTGSWHAGDVVGCCVYTYSWAIFPLNPPPALTPLFTLCSPVCFCCESGPRCSGLIPSLQQAPLRVRLLQQGVLNMISVLAGSVNNIPPSMCHWGEKKH